MNSAARYIFLVACLVGGMACAQTNLPTTKPFYFRLFSDNSKEPVEGEVYLLESSQAPLVFSYPGNQVVEIGPPKNRTGTYHAVVIAPGYKEMRRIINFATPAASATGVGTNSEFIISFPLLPVSAGDFVTLRQVLFYDHSDVMKPEAKRELDLLAQVLIEKPELRIKIYGHCNGDGSRQMVLRGSADVYFGDPTSTLTEQGSAKKLTLLRAESAKAYLIGRGVIDRRIQTVGVGGKQMIYPIDGTMSALNDRVEVEIVR